MSGGAERKTCEVSTYLILVFESLVLCPCFPAWLTFVQAESLLPPGVLFGVAPLEVNYKLCFGVPGATLPRVCVMCIFRSTAMWCKVCSLGSVAHIKPVFILGRRVPFETLLGTHPCSRRRVGFWGRRRALLFWRVKEACVPWWLV